MFPQTMFFAVIHNGFVDVHKQMDSSSLRIFLLAKKFQEVYFVKYILLLGKDKIPFQSKQVNYERATNLSILFCCCSVFVAVM